MKSNSIAIDFDGTCCQHDFPHIGKDIGAADVLKELTDAGHKIILFTMRSDRTNKDGKEETFLTDAVNWFKELDIPLYGIQTNPTQKHWTSSPKCYAEYYIDDAAIGCPLIYTEEGRPYADWSKIREELVKKGLLV